MSQLHAEPHEELSKKLSPAHVNYESGWKACGTPMGAACVPMPVELCIYCRALRTIKGLKGLPGSLPVLYFYSVLKIQI